MVVVLLAAKIGGEFAERLGQPAVLGELLAGVLLGNATLAGVHSFAWLAHTPGLELMAEIGVILLLFEVGLECRVHELMAVGPSAMAVAHVGVIAPIVLGYAASGLLFAGQPWYVHLFTGTTLAATSVGITARVLRDLGKAETKEARIILGAAVVDDVLGLVVLAVVSGMLTSLSHGGQASVDWSAAAIIVGKAAAFLAGAIWLGRLIHVNSLKVARYFRVDGMPLILAVCWCFAMSALAHTLGLAPIVGAFAAGLVLEDDDYYYFVQRGVRPIGESIRPIAAIFVPMFFVLMGIRVELGSFTQPGILLAAAVITIVAVLGKQACSLVVLDKTVDRLTVGLGMIPRGEVGLIFTSIGTSLVVFGQPVFDSGRASVMIVMVMLTTLITPPLLKWSLGRRR